MTILKKSNISIKVSTIFCLLYISLSNWWKVSHTENAIDQPSIYRLRKKVAVCSSSLYVLLFCSYNTISGKIRDPGAYKKDIKSASHNPFFVFWPCHASLICEALQRLFSLPVKCPSGTDDLSSYFTVVLGILASDPN